MRATAAHDTCQNAQSRNLVTTTATHSKGHSLISSTDEPVFRILSPTAILGYGFPEDSFVRGLRERIDLIAVDAGSVDAGPYYLGSDKHYVGRASLERDLRLLIHASLEQRCPLIIGSAGFSGANPQCDEVVELIKTLAAEASSRPLKLGVIHADVPSDLVADHIDKLQALGRMPEPRREALLASKIVGQMGVEPIITALRQDVDILVCGRAYDPAVFAAAPIAAGFDPGICYHAGKILECGAIACLPGSGSDCLIAEIHRDGHAEFRPTNPERRCTPASIAAHSLYEKSRPDYFHLPGGLLSIQDSRFYAIDEHRTGVTGSRFISQPPSIKLEGARALGERLLSVVTVDKNAALDPGLPVYGRNGVEAGHSDDELGIVVLVVADDAGTAHDVLAALRSGLLHYGYPGRVSTAGNVAFPCSPSDIDCQHQGRPASFFIAGTRDPVFREQWPRIQESLLQQVAAQVPALFRQCSIEFHTSDARQGFAWIDSCDDAAGHQATLDKLADSRLSDRLALESVAAGTVYEWTLQHLLTDSALLQTLFPLSCWQLEPDSKQWRQGATLPCDAGNAPLAQGPLPDPEQGLIPDTQGTPLPPSYALRDIASVIRSKNAGINELTYDIFFKHDDYLDYAVHSGAFSANNVSAVLGIDPGRILVILAYRPACALKITVQRASLAGNPGDRDIFGAQQHAALMALDI